MILLNWSLDTLPTKTNRLGISLPSLFVMSRSYPFTQKVTLRMPSIIILHYCQPFVKYLLTMVKYTLADRVPKGVYCLYLYLEVQDEKSTIVDTRIFEGDA